MKLSEYKLRTINFTRQWVEGVSTHNNVDNECLPDFSCCKPEMFICDVVKRRKIYAELLARYGVTQ